MSKVFTITPLPDDYGLGPEYERLQNDAKPNTVDRIAGIVGRFDGSNETELAQEICHLIFGGGPMEAKGN